MPVVCLYGKYAAVASLFAYLSIKTVKGYRSYPGSVQPDSN